MNFGENQKKYPVEIIHHFLRRTKNVFLPRTEKNNSWMPQETKKETRKTASHRKKRERGEKRLQSKRTENVN